MLNNLGEFQRNYVDWKTQFQKMISSMIPFIKHSWITKSRYGEQISVCQGLGTGVGKWIWTIEGILEVMTLFCILNVASSIFWLWFCTILLRTVTADGNWPKDSRDLPILYLANAYESTNVNLQNKISVKK